MIDAAGVLRWSLLLAYGVFLAVTSLKTSVPAMELVWDKLLHAGAYALLAWLALWACHGSRPDVAVRPTVAAAAASVGYGGLLELVQALAPERYPSLSDFAANAGGIGVGLGAWLGWRKLRRRSRRRSV